MFLYLPLLSSESSVSVKEKSDRKKWRKAKDVLARVTEIFKSDFTPQIVLNILRSVSSSLAFGNFCLKLLF